jgi:hypothetical protein
VVVAVEKKPEQVPFQLVLRFAEGLKTKCAKPFAIKCARELG